MLGVLWLRPNRSPDHFGRRILSGVQIWPLFCLFFWSARRMWTIFSIFFSTDFSIFWIVLLLVECLEWSGCVRIVLPIILVERFCLAIKSDLVFATFSDLHENHHMYFWYFWIPFFIFFGMFFWFLIAESTMTASESFSRSFSYKDFIWGPNLPPFFLLFLILQRHLKNFGGGITITTNLLVAAGRFLSAILTGKLCGSPGWS